MAKITFSIAEAIRTVNANDIISEPITQIEAGDETISLRLKTGWPAPKYISAAVRYVEFVDGKAIFEITMNRVIDKLDWLVCGLLSSLNLPDYVSYGEYPRVYLDVNKMLAQKVKGIRIENVTFEDGRFCVTTHSG